MDPFYIFILTLLGVLIILLFNRWFYEQKLFCYYNLKCCKQKINGYTATELNEIIESLPPPPYSPTQTELL
jgi:hypothetical protein